MKQSDRISMMNMFKGTNPIGDAVRKLLIVQALAELDEDKYGDLGYRCETLLIKQKRGIITVKEFMTETTKLLKEFGDPAYGVDFEKA